MTLVKADFRIIPARSDETNVGWIWLRRGEIPSRSLVKIKSGERRETRDIDFNDEVDVTRENPLWRARETNR